MTDHQAPTLHEQLRREAEYLSDCRHHLDNAEWMQARLKALADFLIEVSGVLEASHQSEEDVFDKTPMLRAEVQRLEGVVSAQSKVIEAGLIGLLEGKSNALIVNADGAFIDIDADLKKSIFVPSWVRNVTIRSR